MDASKLMELMKAKKQSLKVKEKTLKPNPGSNRYVILPGWRKGEEQVWFHDFGQHFIKNAAGEIQAVYPCADKTYGQPCAVCSGLAAGVRSAPDEETTKLLTDAKAQQTYLLNVLALDSAEPGVPMILEIKKSAFGQIVDIVEQWGMTVFDPEAPQVISIERAGKGLLTKYTAQISPKKHPVPAGVTALLHNLDEFVNQENKELQNRALNAINNVAGLLSSPSTAASSPADIPRTSPSAVGSLSDATTTTTASPALSDELDDLLADLTGTDS